MDICALAILVAIEQEATMIQAVTEDRILQGSIRRYCGFVLIEKSKTALDKRGLEWG